MGEGEFAALGPRIYSCCNCRSHVADHDDVISKAFQAASKMICRDVTGGTVWKNAENRIKPISDGYERGEEGRHGRAYLFGHVVNVSTGPKEDRQLMTGLHTVADVFCFHCREVLGWKYERAYEEPQRYKEGKYILEKAKIMKENW